MGATIYAGVGPPESGEGFRPTEESTTTLELELGQHKSVVGIEQRDGWHRADCQACSRPLQEDMPATDPRSCPAGSVALRPAGYAASTVWYGNHASIRGFAVIDDKVPKGTVQPSSGCHHPFPSLSKAVRPLFRVTSSEAGGKLSSSSAKIIGSFSRISYTLRQMPRIKRTTMINQSHLDKLSLTAKRSSTSCLSLSISAPLCPTSQARGLGFRHILTGEELLVHVRSVHTAPVGSLDKMSESRGPRPCMKSDGRRKGSREYKAILYYSPPLVWHQWLTERPADIDLSCRIMLWLLADGNGATSQEFMIRDSSTGSLGAAADKLAGRGSPQGESVCQPERGIHVLLQVMHKSQDTSSRRANIRSVSPQEGRHRVSVNVERVSHPEKGLDQTAR
ncbi:hypothetical protein M747DRAFT_317977 [Aspergillus niger ATCC 13496]|uniref:Uncharacterized protein n=3 Tax=Aspergillus niger TaxID=5061 RepID=A2R8N2_ASPNC|nr:hypothetical protein An16g07750 [Aspergillus niger]RDH16256.1 hypothetical protein M747DRAFT_317977 [Aspergillus niger ATCC 13496]CAK47025.1 hypothetical protein An16g07750 [Aspergillus niger]